MDLRRFKSDLYGLTLRACEKDGAQVRSKVMGIADVLVGLYRKNMVKINHSALELVCARGLILQGYEVKVEHKLDRMLVCDVMGERADGRFIIEIETGFIPPEAALEPAAYARGRIASKIARYSRFAQKFALGTTPSYVLDFSRFFVEHPRDRSVVEAGRIKAMTDVKYNRPSISLEELMVAKLSSVVVVDVDSCQTLEVDPGAYLREAGALVGRDSQGLNRHFISSERGFDFARTVR